MEELVSMLNMLSLTPQSFQEFWLMLSQKLKEVLMSLLKLQPLHQQSWISTLMPKINLWSHQLSTFMLISLVNTMSTLLSLTLLDLQKSKSWDSLLMLSYKCQSSTLTERWQGILEQPMSLFKLDITDTQELSVLDHALKTQPRGSMECLKELRVKRPSMLTSWRWLLAPILLSQSFARALKRAIDTFMGSVRCWCQKRNATCSIILCTRNRELGKFLLQMCRMISTKDLGSDKFAHMELDADTLSKLTKLFTIAQPEEIRPMAPPKKCARL